jgi:CheY-like chemotaxis protein
MEAISNLAAGVAHHFNNVLMGILGASRMAARHLDPQDPAQTYLAEIGAAADRGAELTRMLVAFGRARDPQLRPHRIAEVIGPTRNLLRDLLGEDVRTSVVIEHPDACVLADREQLQQLLVNLAMNSRDAMPEGGELTISSRALELAADSPLRAPATTPGRYVEIKVHDTGRGMDAATASRAFEPFFTTKQDGTGLGLYIVYGVVQSLGGQVDIESEPGKGTTLRILLPRHECAKISDKSAGNGTSGARARSPRVLVVEDERLIRITLRHTLQENGFEVLCAADVPDALEMFSSSGPIDLLLTDMVLPTGGGAELARTLTERQPNLPVLFMSAYPRELLVRQGRLDPGVPSLEKPFSEETLLASLHGALGRAVAVG